MLYISSPGLIYFIYNWKFLPFDLLHLFCPFILMNEEGNDGVVWEIEIFFFFNKDVDTFFSILIFKLV